MNPTGIGVTNGYEDISDLLNLGELGTYLVLDVDGAEDHVRAIRARYPTARIVMRHYGGIAGVDVARHAENMSRPYPYYRSFGITDWCYWNEPDLEEGLDAGAVASFAFAFEQAIRPLCPDIRLHFPAFSGERFYQDPDQWIWIPVARLYDVIDLHAYLDAAHVKAYIDWAAARFPDKPCLVTEFNYGLGNLRPAHYGEEIYRAFAHAAAAPNCEGVCPFIWTWVNGPTQELDISRDPEAQAAIRQAAADFRGPEPDPEPERPMMTCAIYLHQFDRNYRERSYREFARTAKEYGIEQVWFKAWQGGSLAVWDKSALGLSTYDRIARCFDECASEGVEAVMWGVPQGGTWRADAAICKAIGARCGGKAHIDLENFKGFWDAPTYGTTGQPPFFQMLKDAELWVDVSAVGRFGEPELTPWEEIVDLVDSVWLQSYFTDFLALAQVGPEARAALGYAAPEQVFAHPELALAIADHFKDQPRTLSAGPVGYANAATVVRDDLNAMLRQGIPIEKLGIILPHNGTRSELDAGWGIAQQLGVTRASIWVWDWVKSLAPFEFLKDLGGAAPGPIPNDTDHWLEMHNAAKTLVLVTEPGRTEMPDGSELTEERSLGEVGRILQIVDRHRQAIAGD